MIVTGLLIPIVLIVVILLIVFGIKNSQGIEGEDVVKNVFNYLVLFATLMMTIGGSVAAFMAVADIVSPAPYYQSFEEYKNWGSKPMTPEGEDIEQELSDEELRANYEAMVASEKERTKQRAVNNLIKSFGWIVIPLPIFIYFKRRLKTE